jgi:hypothetical protein
MMGARTVVVGRMEKLTDTEFAPAPKGWGNIPVHGNTVSKFQEFTRGQVAILSKANGFRENVMD